ncbi:sialidase family protein [Microlunatus speluncae]|uniref:sialidase family protein n=1 Tax=Microlunatus speluncae TaxID=2594267 RepID=UPI0012663174|nr:sialidase family protein [Microlunatus speluncae]
MSSSLHSEVIFDPADSGYHTYRIPALINSGPTVLAFCEGRVSSGSDSGKIDIVLRRSTDGGTTWGPVTVVHTTDDATCGNPAPVIDPASGDVVLLSVRNPAALTEKQLHVDDNAYTARRVFLQRSTDLGQTWSEPAEITDTVKRRTWGWYATGPCHGIALSRGPHAGRLLIPANHSVIPEPGQDPQPRHRFSGGHCIVSDDGGRSWRIGFVDDHVDDADPEAINPNESAAVELADGRVYFNTRNFGSRLSGRVHAWSGNGGDELEQGYRSVRATVAPDVQAALLRLPDDRLVLSTPRAAGRRVRLGLYLANARGTGWRRGPLIHSGPAAYSDLALLPADPGDATGGEGRLGVLYEAGEQRAYEQIRLARLPLSMLANGG